MTRDKQFGDQADMSGTLNGARSCNAETRR